MCKAFRALLLGLLLVGGSSSAIAAAADSAGPSGPIRQVALGVSVKASRSLAAVDRFTARVGRSPALWSVWSSWGATDRAFPDTTFLEGLRLRHVVPIIIWQPANPANPDGDSRYRYSRIIAGRFDTYLRHWAEAAKAWGGQVVVRFAHEMNGYWFPWGVSRFDNTPQKFIQAWRHVWNIIRGPAPAGVGAKNVKFLWSPGSPCPRCAPYASIYPGKKYVDYVGFTAFNWSTPQPWKSMVRKFTSPMRALAKVSKKPVIAAETGSSNLGGDKAAWIRDGYPAVYKRFPTIKAIVYFNLDMRYVGQPNWLLTAPPGALTAYRDVVAQPRFQGKLP